MRVEDEQDIVAEKEKEKKGLLAFLVVCFGDKIIRIEAEQERRWAEPVAVASRMLPRDLSSRAGMLIASILSSAIT